MGDKCLPIMVNDGNEGTCLTSRLGDAFFLKRDIGPLGLNGDEGLKERFYSFRRASNYGFRASEDHRALYQNGIIGHCFDQFIRRGFGF